MEKINLLSFNQTALLARLYCLQRNFYNSGGVDRFDNPGFVDYVNELADANFIYPEGKKNFTANNLAFFLLHQPSAFDKFIEL